MDLENLRKVRPLLRNISSEVRPGSPLLTLSLLLQNISKHKYQNRDTFLSDVTLVHGNSIKYNGR